MPATRKSPKGPKDKIQQPAPTETTDETIIETTTEITANATPAMQEPQAKEQETLPLTLRPPTAIEERVKAAGFANMGLGPMTAEDTEERQLSDDRTAQILERSRIGTALFYVPTLNPVWKVGYIGLSPTHNCGC
jgi:hypothetical protein